jgi:triacylglycerol esterase/lipase EstA (alpha/beta hydrolase family)
MISARCLAPAAVCHGLQWGATPPRNGPVLARYARRLLFIEFALYALVALLVHALGLGWPAALALIPALALLTRCVAVGSTFLVAAALSTAEERAPRRRLRLVAAETFWATLAYSVLMPFPRLAGRPDSRLPRQPGVMPVLLVHGYVCNRGIWACMRRYLEKNGVPAYTHDLEPVYAGIDDYIPALAARIEDVCAKTGARQLAIIAHSMGGLAARAYLRAHGPARVATVLALGTPHHGTRAAAFGQGENARQMRPGSAWLEALARAESAGAAVPMTSIYTADDNVVVPAESAALGWGRNVRLSGVGHVSLAYAAPVRKLVLENVREVRSPGRT